MMLLSRSEMKKFVQGLNTDEAARILRALLDEAPDLTKKIYDTALKLVSGVDPDSIKEDVCYELDILDLDELSSRSGRTRYGYVDPHDAVWEMFEEALDPFIDEMKKNQQRKLPAVAKIHCIGIIKGLWSYEKESVSDFKDWVPDAPGEYIQHVIDEWKKGNPSDEDIAEVMEFVKDGQS
jgi:hypothetical protein